jgi:hypothetical protein
VVKSGPERVRLEENGTRRRKTGRRRVEKVVDFCDLELNQVSGKRNAGLNQDRGEADQKTTELAGEKQANILEKRWPIFVILRKSGLQKS